jgi:major membrane immunogen (membrane-anchored lipoprotein)
MRVVVAVALILLLAACGSSKKTDAEGSTATTAPAITSPTGKVVAHRGEQALRLHQGQSKAVMGQDVLVVCVSHGVTLSARTPAATSGATVGRDVFKRGPRGTASLTVSNANGTVTADCR